MKKVTKKVVKVKKEIVHVLNDASHIKKEFAVKHPPNLKPKGKRAK
ncbi:MAG: hypothetical protein QG566_704 [Patescibacteria group bacterium]|jgi:hypothetical protein|nr:hypothetical protein [Patescibacteria group bacterium]